MPLESNDSGGICIYCHKFARLLQKGKLVISGWDWAARTADTLISYQRLKSTIYDHLQRKNVMRNALRRRIFQSRN